MISWNLFAGPFEGLKSGVRHSLKSFETVATNVQLYQRNWLVPPDLKEPWLSHYSFFRVWEVDIEIRAPQPNTPSPYKELNLKRTNQLKSINTWRCQHWNALDSCAIAIHCHYHSQHTAMKIPLNTSSAAHNSSHSGHPDRLQDLYPKNAWVNPCFRINEMAMFSPISPMSYKASNLRWPTSYRIIAVIKCHGYLPLPSLEW